MPLQPNDPRVIAYCQEFEEFARLSAARPPRFRLSWDDRYPCLDEKTATTEFDRHYLFHTAWAARAVASIRPELHVDISSSLYFCALVSAFVPVDFYDYRPAAFGLSQLRSGRADLVRLPFPDRSVRSLSCMHVVEHVGLGRYGDPLDPDGDLRAMSELARVVANGGDLLFVVPVGQPRVQFNAHRVYSFEQVRQAFSELTLVQFALIPDDPARGGLLVDAPPELVASQRYGRVRLLLVPPSRELIRGGAAHPAT